MKREYLRTLRNIVPYGYMCRRHDETVAKKFNDNCLFDEPELYNSNGEKLCAIFLRDDAIGREYYSFTRHRKPKYIFWDKANPYLKKHFYGHYDIKNVIGCPSEKYAILIETESILTTAYDLLYNNSGLASEFKYIFTHSSRLLNKYENARFVPCGGVWYGLPGHGGLVSSDLYQLKRKGISIVSSNKKMCDLHKLRIEIAQICKKRKDVDTFGNFDGGKIVPIAETLQDYRYSIIFENVITEYCFTEKILNCFMSMTIPIYLGAIKIGDFFNLDGIIVIDTNIESNLPKVLRMCDEKYYLSHLDAVIDNYNRVKKYLCQEDYIASSYRDVLK